MYVDIYIIACCLPPPVLTGGGMIQNLPLLGGLEILKINMETLFFFHNAMYTIVFFNLMEILQWFVYKKN